MQQVALAILPGLAVFWLVGLVGLAQVRLARRLNRRAGLSLIDGDRWAANTTALAGFLSLLPGYLLWDASSPLGPSIVVGALASSYWNHIFRLRARTRAALLER
jgi:hypothetical protein